MSETRGPARWTKFEDADHGATPTFGISYRSDEGLHILCNNMYEWQADWLVKVLNQFCTREVPDPPHRSKAICPRCAGALKIVGTEVHCVSCSYSTPGRFA